MILTITHGESHIDRALGALTSQKPVPEIIVPVYPALENVEELRKRWPGVIFVVMEDDPPRERSLSHWLYDRRRATGLNAASGDIVAITEDHAIPGEEWGAAIRELHRAPYAVIGGAIEHSGTGMLNWALYFCDFGRYQKPFEPGAAIYVSDINVSYKRAALEKCRAVRTRFYDEATVHGYLRSNGETLWLTPALSIDYDRGRLRWRDVLPERFIWARVFAGRRAQKLSLSRRAALALLSPGLPFLLAGRRAVAVIRGGRHVRRFLASLPAMLFVLSVWSVGELAGYVTARPFSRPLPALPRESD